MTYFNHVVMFRSDPQGKNTISAFQIKQTTFFYLEKFLKKLTDDDQCSSITKGSIYHIKYMYIQPFSKVVD